MHSLPNFLLRNKASLQSSSESAITDSQEEKKEGNIIRIGTASRKKRRRRYELLAACLLLLFVLGTTWAQLEIYELDSWLFIVLLNINSLLLLVVLFLVARNVVKLIMERRRHVFGAKIRTRLVIIFISLSLVPTLIMFLASNRLVITSVDYWFTSQTESSMRAALDVGQSFYAASAAGLSTRVENILHEIMDRKLLWSGEKMNALLENKRKEYGLVLAGLVSPNGSEQLWHSSEEFSAIWKQTAKQIDWAHVATHGFGSLLWAAEDADYVIGILSVDEGKSGFLVIAESIGHGLLAKLERISRGFTEYSRLKQLKKPLRVSLMMILGILGMIIIFGSVWFGFRLSKEITAPILALARGTARIAQGDLDVRLEDNGNDEIAQLVQSFNHMAGDLQQSRANLTRTYDLLAHQNKAVADRNQYIETVLDNITTGIITLNAQGQIVTMNKAACTILNQKNSDLEGKYPADFLPPQYQELFCSVLENLREHPEQQWQRQEDFFIGERNWKLMLHALAMSGSEGISAYIVAIEDITELEKMQKMAAWREVAKRIAHEIKNPLTPIKLSAQRLEHKFGAKVQDQVFGQCTELIVKQVERLQEMVQEFSAFAKLPEVHLLPGDISPLLQELTSFFQNSHSQIIWELNISENLPRIAMDIAALHRVLLNIFTNAAEALNSNDADPAKQKKVQINASSDQNKGTLRIVINDNGPGLTPDEQKRLFEPYFSRKKGGTGLGLTIAKSIITDHRGTICAISAPGGGTSLILDFPLYQQLVP